MMSASSAAETSAPSPNWLVSKFWQNTQRRLHQPKKIVPEPFQPEAILFAEMRLALYGIAELLPRRREDTQYEISAPEDDRPSPWRVAGITSRKRSIAFILAHRGNNPTQSRLCLYSRPKTSVGRAFALAIHLSILVGRDWHLRQVPSSLRRADIRHQRSCLARFASRLAHSTSAFRAPSDMLDRCKHPTQSPMQSRPQRHRSRHLALKGESRVPRTWRSTYCSVACAIPTYTLVAMNGTTQSILSSPVMRLSAE